MASRACQRQRLLVTACGLIGAAWAAVHPRVALAQPLPEPVDRGPEQAREDAAEAEAKERFFKGLELFNASQWGAALAEFEQSRALHPTRGATRNAAICLKNLGRYDESLALYELWQRAFPQAPSDERALVDEEARALARLVGTLDVRVNEAGATVFVDGTERGKTPLPGPLRVAAGARLVQVYKDGYVAAQTTTSVAGATSAVAKLELRPLAQSGRLRVRELEGRASDVLVDGIKVGAAPWEGALAPGEHHVVLTAAGELGSQPVAAPVKLGDVTSLSIELEPVPATIAIHTDPPGAVIALDGVAVGRGSFRGRVRLGSHRLEVGLEGYVAVSRSVSLTTVNPPAFAITLERDRTSAVWKAAPQPRFAIGMMAGPVLGGSFAGDASSQGCAEQCSATPLYGALALGTLGYRWPLGITAGADFGYLGAFQRVVGRDATLFELPDALRRDIGEVDDALALQGLLAGPSLAIDGGDKLVWRVRLSTGIHVANAAVRRIGRFVSSGSGTPYTTDAYGENDRALSVYIAPEAHLGFRLAPNLELGVGATPILLIGLDEPRWRNERDILTPSFLGFYPEESLTGKIVFAVSPTLGVTALF